jgi:hypothetical protein
MILKVPILRIYEPDFPVVCMGESSIQLIGEVQDPIPAAPGHPELIDDEYVRNGVASIFLEVEPLGGKRQVKITERRTRVPHQATSSASIHFPNVSAHFFLFGCGHWLTEFYAKPVDQFIKHVGRSGTSDTAYVHRIGHLGRGFKMRLALS